MSLVLIPIIRYVDDFFGVCFKWDAQAARDYIVETVGMCGFAGELEKTPLPAPSHTTLGISLNIVHAASRDVEHLRLHVGLDRCKAECWKALVDGIPVRGRMTRKNTEQIAGSFVCVLRSSWTGWVSAVISCL